MDDRQETSLIEIMVCCVKQAATGEYPVGRGPNRKVGLSTSIILANYYHFPFLSLAASYPSNLVSSRPHVTIYVSAYNYPVSPWGRPELLIHLQVSFSSSQATLEDVHPFTLTRPSSLDSTTLAPSRPHSSAHIH